MFKVNDKSDMQTSMFSMIPLVLSNTNNNSDNVYYYDCVCIENFQKDIQITVLGQEGQ